MSSVKLARQCFVKPDSFCGTNCEVRKYTLRRNARSQITAKIELYSGDRPVAMRSSGISMQYEQIGQMAPVQCSF